MGGEERHTLSVNEMPSHRHTWGPRGSSSSSHGLGISATTSGGTTTDRNMCLSEELLSWDNDCYNNNWLRTNNQYTITPSSQSSNQTVIIFASGRGLFFGSYYQRSVYPTVFLKSTIKIIDGDGSSDNPYRLSI